MGLAPLQEFLVFGHFLELLKLGELVLFLGCGVTHGRGEKLRVGIFPRRGQVRRDFQVAARVPGWL